MLAFNESLLKIALFQIVFFICGSIYLNGGYASALDGGLKDAQIFLKRLGYDLWEPRETIGPHTHEAIKAFQSNHGLPANGKLDKEVSAHIAKICHEYEQCLSEVVNDLKKKIKQDVEVDAGFKGYEERYNLMVNVKVGGGSFTLDWTDSAPEVALANMQAFVEGKRSAKPVVSRCDQAASNFLKNSVTDKVHKTMEFVKVPKGCFQMGSDNGSSHEKPATKCVWLNIG